MNTDTEANINKALEWLQQTGGAIQDFASEQAPLYCQEVVAWELWRGFFFGGIGLAFILLGIIAAYIFWKSIIHDDEGLGMISAAVFMVSIILGTAMLLVNSPSAIKAIVSPRLVIVDHLNKLRK